MEYLPPVHSISWWLHRLPLRVDYLLSQHFQHWYILWLLYNLVVCSFIYCRGKTHLLLFILKQPWVLGGCPIGSTMALRYYHLKKKNICTICIKTTHEIVVHRAEREQNSWQWNGILHKHPDTPGSILLPDDLWRIYSSYSSLQLIKKRSLHEGTVFV